MTTTKLANFGRSPAIDRSEQVCLLKNDLHNDTQDDASAIRSLGVDWSSVIESLDLFSADFMETRNQPEPQIREALFP